MKTAVFLSLLFLASCATPPPPATGGGVVMDGLQAAATQTTIAATQQAAPIETAAAIATAATMADNATRQAAIIATQTAAPIETAQAIAIEVTRQAQATAASHADSMEAIAIASFATREAGNTIATRAVQNLEVGAIAKNARRWEWVKDVGAGSVLFVFLFGSCAFIAIQYIKARTIIIGDELWVYNGRSLIDEPEQPIQIPARRAVPYTPNNGDTQTIEMIRPSFEITRANGRAIIYTLTGADLDALEMNIRSGDHGFRRRTSDAGRGMDDLIGLSDGDKYKAILAVMKERQWVTGAGGSSNKWTQYGAREVLEMDALPPENDAGE